MELSQGIRVCLYVCLCVDDTEAPGPLAFACVTSWTARCVASRVVNVTNAYPRFAPVIGSIIRRKSHMVPHRSNRGISSSSYMSFGIFPQNTSQPAPGVPPSHPGGGPPYLRWPVATHCYEYLILRYNAKLDVERTSSWGYPLQYDVWPFYCRGTADTGDNHRLWQFATPRMSQMRCHTKKNRGEKEFKWKGKGKPMERRIGTDRKEKR